VLPPSIYNILSRFGYASRNSLWTRSEIIFNIWRYFFLPGKMSLPTPYLGIFQWLIGSTFSLASQTPAPLASSLVPSWMIRYKVECEWRYRLFVRLHLNVCTQTQKVEDFHFAITYLLTYYMEQRPSWEANCFCS